MTSPVDGGVVLLTGASSGIGREMARQLAPRARTLILVARRRDRLDALRDELVAQHPALTVTLRPADLADLAAVEQLAEDCLTEGPVDVLINNAGLGDHVNFADASPEKIQAMLMVNVVALTTLTHRLVPGMIERRRGGILNISSGFGLVSMPGFAVYCGTKHYVSAFTDALAGELAGTGVHVTQVCPGPVRTEFAEVAELSDDLAPPGFVWLSAEDCARESLAALDRNKPLVVPGTTMKAAMLMGQRLPRWLTRTVGHRLTATRRTSTSKR